MAILLADLPGCARQAGRRTVLSASVADDLVAQQRRFTRRLQRAVAQLAELAFVGPVDAGSGSAGRVPPDWSGSMWVRNSLRNLARLLCKPQTAASPKGQKLLPVMKLAMYSMNRCPDGRRPPPGAGECFRASRCPRGRGICRSFLAIEAERAPRRLDHRLAFVDDDDLQRGWSDLHALVVERRIEVGPQSGSSMDRPPGTTALMGASSCGPPP